MNAIIPESRSGLAIVSHGAALVPELRFQVTADAVGQAIVTPASARGAQIRLRERKRFTEVSLGPVSVKIYRTSWRDKKRSKRYLSHTIAYQEIVEGRAKRRREKRSCRQDALERAEIIVTRLANNQTAMLQFGDADRASYLRSAELAQSIGVPLELLVAEAVESRKLLAGRATLAEACREYNAHHPAGLDRRHVPKIVEDFFAKRTFSAKHLRNISKMLERFAGRFDCPLDVLQPRELEDWLDSLKKRNGSPIGLRTRRNHLSAIENLANFAKARGYVDKDWNVLADISNPEPPTVSINLYTPDELVMLLTTAEASEAGKKLVPLIVITAFAGVRHGEMNEEKVQHLDWADIDWEAKRIYIDAAAAKQTGRSDGDDRFVDMPENLLAWLEPYRRASGKICSLANTSNALCRLRRKAGITGPKKNALRKSFITYKLALGVFIDAVANQAGNSPGVIRRNYRAARHTRLHQVAERWFKLMPSRAQILFPFAAAQGAKRAN